MMDKTMSGFWLHWSKKGWAAASSVLTVSNNSQ